MSLISTLRGILTMGRGVVRGLEELEVRDDPVAFFGAWFEHARRAGLYLPEAMTLATASSDGAPSSRMVLLKSFDADGFVFYTNYGSRKAREADENPKGALLFHWSVLQRQVRVEGTLTRVPREESEAYFRTRARGSQIGAWASHQSDPLANREALEREVDSIRRRFEGQDVPLPEFWGGYRLIPQVIEFWQGRANRLHDRLVYTRVGNEWKVARLNP